MRKHCSNVCKFCPCLATESTNSAPMRTIVAAAAIFANGTYFLDNPRITVLSDFQKYNNVQFEYYFVSYVFL